LPLRDPAAWPIARQRLGRVFGLANFTLAHEVRLAADARESLTRVGDIVLAHLAGRPVPSFRVATKRSDKRFPPTPPAVNRGPRGGVGGGGGGGRGGPVVPKGAVLPGGPDILPGRAFVSLEKGPGAGGLPVGTSGRVLALLSGGIDSPVAAWRMMRRGCHVDFVHFHSVPFLDRTSQEKARELVRLLSAWELGADLFLVPFGEVQRQIVAAVQRPLRAV